MDNICTKCFHKEVCAEYERWGSIRGFSNEECIYSGNYFVDKSDVSLRSEQKEMTAREFQKEALRMAESVLPGGFDFGCERTREGEECSENCPKWEMHCCAGQIEVENVLLDPDTIGIVQRWAAEHPKPEPISAKDYKKLKAIYSLCGDCWVTASMEDNAVIVCTKQPQKVENYWICEGEFARLGFIELSCLSWQDPEPLHLTAEWLKEVEHE